MSKETRGLPKKIFPVNYAGFWDFSINGLYGDSVINEEDYPNAGHIAGEMSKRYNEYPDLLAASLQNAELLKELGDLVEDHYSGRIGNYGFASSVKQIVQKYTDKK